jgi:signal transduction histidine kinase/CheY-like chemotaxis protein
MSRQESARDHFVVPALPRNVLVRHGLALLILLGILTVTTVGAVSAASVVRDQEGRLLNQRATEAAAYVVSTFGGIRTSLVSVGTVALASTGQSDVLTKLAGSASTSGNTISVVQRTPAGLRRIETIGSKQPASQTGLTAPERELIERALGASNLVTRVIADSAHSTLLMAINVPSATPTVVLAVSPLRPTQSPPGAANSPYRDLDTAIYAAATADPKSLLAVSGDMPSPAKHPVVRPVIIGSDTWTLVITARHPLGGAFAADFPWLIGGVGAVLAIVIALLVEVLTRRRVYAYKLVQQRTRTLREAQAAAEQANLAKSEFLSRMSHELRTPLNAVLGFGQLLEMDELSPDQKESVKQIIKGGRHLLDLINEVLDISHIEAGRLSLSNEAVLVGEIVAETIDLMRPLARDRSLTLMGPPGDGREIFVLADRQRLKQILLNLVSNAIKYNRHGGSVSISCHRGAGETLRIEVTDTGPGIPESQFPLLFTPFERLGAEQTTVEGTGIGLALSHKLAEALGGSLGVESTVGRGSTFWVEFPVVEGPIDRYERLQRQIEPAQLQDYGDQKAKVLYIEDNLSNLKLIERVLTQRPHVELIAAMQGQLGLELAREHRPVVIFLDLNLADLPGDQVLRKLRDDPDTAHIPVVIVSADATPRVVQRLLNEGAYAYLTKPIDVVEVIRIIDGASTVAASATPAANNSV